MDQQDDFDNRTYPVKEDMTRERWAWRVERAGWYVLMLIVALTLLGLFSKGPLSSVTVASDDGALRVEYERFSRNGAEETMTITAKGHPGEPLQVVLGARLLEGMAIEALQPESGPAHSQGRDLVIPLRADNNGEAILYLTLRSNGAWMYRSEIALSTGARVAVPKFIYP
ncbi:hypothetical protein [Pseudomonas sp. RIT-PI-S]|uniref:hypothetical protein n=1 Tax=Pseudomonas sp. RIT-PI-S TaxID=3035295 RepID=UPI0021DAA8AB|nr:hypothetical protein [Pseudomonas sp. RIT-PI-S]